MYGLGAQNEWEQFFDSSRNRQESPQLMQGLLSSPVDTNNTLNEIISKNMNKAAQLGQFAQTANPAAGNDLLSQRQNSVQQLAQQAMAQQSQQDAQNMGLLTQIARMFFK